MCGHVQPVSRIFAGQAAKSPRKKTASVCLHTLLRHMCAQILKQQPADKTRRLSGRLRITLAHHRSADFSHATPSSTTLTAQCAQTGVDQRRSRCAPRCRCGSRGSLFAGERGDEKHQVRGTGFGSWSSIDRSLVSPLFVVTVSPLHVVSSVFLCLIHDHT